MTEDYKEMYENLICSLKGLQLGLKCLQEYGVGKVNIKTIYNGIDTAIEESKNIEVEE